MKDGQLVKEICKARGMSVSALARQMGVIQSALSNKLNGRANGMRVDNFLEIMDALGYQVVVVPKGSKVPKGGYMLDMGEDDE